MQDSKIYDVIIIGAGLAGLRAAYEINKLSRDLEILVLEAKSRVGGRTLTINAQSKNGDTDQWDIGGQWVGKTQTHVLDLLKELGLEIYPQYTQGLKIARFGHGSKMRTYSSSVPVKEIFSFRFSPVEIIDFALFMLKLERMCQKLKRGQAEDMVHSWDQTTLSKFAYDNVYTQSVLDLMVIMTTNVFGILPDRISLWYFLHYAASAGSISHLIENTGDGAQGFRIKGGSQQICQILMEKIGADKILLNHPVEKIENYDQERHDEEDKSIKIYSRDKIFKCRHIILAVPFSQANFIYFSPLLPESRRQLMANFPMGNLMKFFITYPTAFWREKGFSGEIVTTGDDIHVYAHNYYGDQHYKLSKPIILCIDATTYKGNPALTGFLSNAWCDKTKDERRNAVVKDLAQYFGKGALEFIEYHDKNWSEEPYSGGCPVNILGPGMMKYYLESSSPIGRLHWAGTETASDWLGYMSGAVQSGIRAAHEVLYHLNPTVVDKNVLKMTAYDKDYENMKKIRIQKYNENNKKYAKRNFAICSCIMVIGLGVSVYYVVKWLDFESPISAKFIKSF